MCSHVLKLLSFKIAMALFVLVMLIVNIGIANAMDESSRTEDLPSSQFLLAPKASSLEMRSGEYFASERYSMVRRLIGSSAPECGHTCGACSPCKVEVVAFECSSEVEVHAEACPLGYLCICHGKAFPIP